ncbi:hypothetical protein PU629_05885 [Pullulanibacillus sp. KACC 23026]|uniref:hypothetical protein n=1 Tax=Pullulanibacillus sp. KACC 23026 TaxID=3028315 RepID=UPI0023B07A77|nr:hypothetical protein [Pullulanibacillus sp. KACC 23026]WEG14907.1 hypothetical protein PU629_05885 [Pullulanibacillus sp. KACC 23026]
MSMVFDRHQLAESKLQLIEKGYSAYTDSQEVARLVRREIEKRKLNVLEELTPIGFWFTPSK